MAVFGIGYFREYLEDLCRSGGPERQQYESLSRLIDDAQREIECGSITCEDMSLVLDGLGRPFSVETLQGLALRKPHGYAGDYEMIDKIYREQCSDDPLLHRWDCFFHAQHAPRAVRNRKAYFHELLDGLPVDGQVLKLGCGPGRSMYEWICNNPESNVGFDCVDIDGDAIAYAESLNRGHLERMSFHQKNVLRFSPSGDGRYDLIWAAGLFDYFDDRVFEMLGKRFFPLLKSGGQLVIGNFSTFNPTRSYMELFGQWHLNYRSADELVELGIRIDRSGLIHVGMEPEGVNLFLHMKRP